MFITLTTIFVVIVIGCIIEVYRTNRAHKKRLERETDECIIWSKEQATKLMEVGAAAAVGKTLLGYKPVRAPPTRTVAIHGLHGCVARAPHNMNMFGMCVCAWFMWNIVIVIRV